MPSEGRFGSCRFRFSLGVFEVFISAAAGQSQQPKTFGNHRKLCKRLNLEFLHQIVSMQFDGSLRGAQGMSNLLVRITANQQLEDFDVHEV